MSIRPLWREVIKFHYLFCHRIYKLQTRIDDERIKLHRDKGASSLRNNSRFHLYAVTNTGSTLVQRLRKASQSSTGFQNGSYLRYSNNYDEELGECSKSVDDDNNTCAGVPSSSTGEVGNKMFRKISISKRKRRGKNSVAGFTKLHDLDEEDEEDFWDNDENDTETKASMGFHSVVSMEAADKIDQLEEDLAELEEKGYYMESDIEEDEEDENDQSSHGSSADYEDSSSSSD